MDEVVSKIVPDTQPIQPSFRRFPSPPRSQLTWEQVGHMLMTFEGFTLEARVKDTIEVLGDRD